MTRNYPRQLDSTQTVLTTNLKRIRAARKSLVATLDAFERRVINAALAKTGSVSHAARYLHTDRPNLNRRMRRLGISNPNAGRNAPPKALEGNAQAA